MFAPVEKKKKSRKSGADGVLNTESEPIDIIVDSLIGFLEHSSAYLRTVANQVFSLLSSKVQESTIDLILAVSILCQNNFGNEKLTWFQQLERRAPAELAENEDEEMDDLANEENDQEPSDDGEVSSADEDEDEDEDDEVDDNNDEDVQELRRKIEEALKVNGIEAATGDSDEDSDEDLMDDDQMMAIDEQLAQVFRSRMNEKKSSKGEFSENLNTEGLTDNILDTDAQREATHFKNRVLDLVDIFIKKQPTSQHIPRMILPLVDLITGTGLDERQLLDKTTGLLRNRIGKTKEFPSQVDTVDVVMILEELHTRARRTRSSEVLTTLSQCSLYLSKVLLLSGAEKSVINVYRGSSVDFITRKTSTLNTAFLQDFIRRYPETGWSLRGDIITASTQATSVYRRCQAFQLLHTIVNQLTTLVRLIFQKLQLQST